MYKLISSSKIINEYVINVLYIFNYIKSNDKSNIIIFFESKLKFELINFRFLSLNNCKIQIL